MITKQTKWKSPRWGFLSCSPYSLPLAGYQSEHLKPHFLNQGKIVSQNHVLYYVPVLENCIDCIISDSRWRRHCPFYGGQRETSFDRLAAAAAFWMISVVAKVHRKCNTRRTRAATRLGRTALHETWDAMMGCTVHRIRLRLFSIIQWYVRSKLQFQDAPRVDSESSMSSKIKSMKREKRLIDQQKSRRSTWTTLENWFTFRWCEF